MTSVILKPEWGTTQSVHCLAIQILKVLSTRQKVFKKHLAAVSCTSAGCLLGGVGLGSGSTGKLGRCMGGVWVHDGDDVLGGYTTWMLGLGEADWSSLLNQPLFSIQPYMQGLEGFFFI